LKNTIVSLFVGLFLFNSYCLFSQSDNSSKYHLSVYDNFAIDLTSLIDTQHFLITQNYKGVKILSKKDSIVCHFFLVNEEVVNVKKRHSQNVENELLNYVFKTYFDNSVQDTSGIFCYSLMNIKKNSMLVNIVPCQFDSLGFNFVNNVLLGLIRYGKEYKIVVVSSMQVVRKKEEIRDSLFYKFEDYFNNLKIN